MRYLGGILAVGLVAIGVACSDGNSPSGSGGNGCATNGGGAAGNVVVGNILSRSSSNGTCDPAVDTVAAGTTVTWTWTNTGGTSHSVESTGATSFTSSAIKSGSGSTHSFQFNTPGTYTYNCGVHGNQMTGRVVVQ